MEQHAGCSVVRPRRIWWIRPTQRQPPERADQREEHVVFPQPWKPQSITMEIRFMNHLAALGSLRSMPPRLPSPPESWSDEGEAAALDR